MVTHQQGDIILEPTDRREIKGRLKKLDSLVLARGEATGFCHEIIKGEVFVDENGNMYVEAEAGTELEHRRGAEIEHRTHELEPDFYRVKRVIAYDHFAEEARRVRD